MLYVFTGLAKLRDWDSSSINQLTQDMIIETSPVIFENTDNTLAPTMSVIESTSDVVTNQLTQDMIIETSPVIFENTDNTLAPTMSVIESN